MPPPFKNRNNALTKSPAESGKIGPDQPPFLLFSAEGTIMITYAAVAERSDGVGAGTEGLPGGAEKQFPQRGDGLRRPPGPLPGVGHLRGAYGAPPAQGKEAPARPAPDTGGGEVRQKAAGRPTGGAAPAQSGPGAGACPRGPHGPGGPEARPQAPGGEAAVGRHPGPAGDGGGPAGGAGQPRTGGSPPGGGAAGAPQGGGQGAPAPGAKAGEKGTAQKGKAPPPRRHQGGGEAGEAGETKKALRREGRALPAGVGLHRGVLHRHPADAGHEPAPPGVGAVDGLGAVLRPQVVPGAAQPLPAGLHPHFGHHPFPLPGTGPAHQPVVPEPPGDRRGQREPGQKGGALVAVPPVPGPAVEPHRQLCGPHRGHHHPGGHPHLLPGHQLRPVGGICRTAPGVHPPGERLLRRPADGAGPDAGGGVPAPGGQPAHLPHRHRRRGGPGGPGDAGQPHHVRLPQRGRGG